jgi:hypothetical protein
MLDLSSVITRLKTICSASFKQIGSAADLAAAADGLPTAPSCYVVPGGYTAQANEMLGITAQRVSEEFDVFIVAKSYSGKGNDAVADIRTLILAVRTALHGWLPATDCVPLEMAGGQRESFEPGVMIWRDSYRTSYEVRT